ncbi:hypothetical protein JZ751_029481 [Albula glossodonta]|uniref:Anterior gradient 1 n=1 Tax=Albula glossodonta TaxID=121402 RepID=A0A8T2PI70_9TELE|nr:hypothetical protein JZ751_029481 [Albula glossodonta]
MQYQTLFCIVLFLTGVDSKKTKKPPQTLSRALKKAFAANENIQKMAQEDFIMLNLVHETTDKNLSPDGMYVPRILFVDPTMTVRADIIGRYSNHLYTYEPHDMPLLEENMKHAKALLKTEL